MMPQLVLAAAAAFTLLATAAPANASALPVVNMEAVVTAAFVEGSQGNRPTIRTTPSRS